MTANQNSCGGHPGEIQLASRDPRSRYRSLNRDTFFGIPLHGCDAGSEAFTQNVSASHRFRTSASAAWMHAEAVIRLGLGTLSEQTVWTV